MYRIIQKFISKVQGFLKNNKLVDAFDTLLGVTLASHGDDYWWHDTDCQVTPAKISKTLPNLTFFCLQVTPGKITKKLGALWAQIFSGDGVKSINKVSMTAIKKKLARIQKEWEEEGPQFGQDMKFPWDKAPAQKKVNPAPKTPSAPQKSKSVPMATVSSPAGVDVSALRAKIAKQLVSLVKKAEHRERNKASSDLLLPITEAQARVLLPGLTKKSLNTPSQVLEFLPELPKTVHPVKNRLKTLMPGGGIYAWAGYSSLDVTYVKKGSNLKLKLKTLYIGSGDPKKCALNYDGYLACGSDKEIQNWTLQKSMELVMGALSADLPMPNRSVNP